LIFLLLVRRLAERKKTALGLLQPSSQEFSTILFCIFFLLTLNIAENKRLKNLNEKAFEEIDRVNSKLSASIKRILFELKNNDGIWFAYDVVIEGISLVNNYRSTFAAIVKNDGMDGLLNDIQLRIDKYKSSNEPTSYSESTEDS